MADAKVLVVYYSRTGHTRTVARRLASVLSADLEEIRIRGEHGDGRGYLRCALDGMLRRRASIQRAHVHATAYDLVVIGTHVWVGSMSSPVRAYLARRRGRLRRVAFFITQSGMGRERVFAQMQKTVGVEPVARLAVTEADIACGDDVSKVRRFAMELYDAEAVEAPQDGLEAATPPGPD